MFRGRQLVELITELFGFPRRYGHGISEVEFNCPRCDKGKNKFNLVVNVDRGLYHCWACGHAGKNEKLFALYGSKDQAHRHSLLLASSLEPAIQKETEVLEIGDFRSLKTKWTDSVNYLAAMAYLKDRRITPDIIDKWDICYAETGKYKNRIIIPSRTLEGKTEFFVARAFYGTVQPKYLNPRFERENIIFGEKFIDWKKPVIVTEGVFDSMVLYNSVPLLGTGIKGNTKLLRKFMQNKTPLIMGMDQDAWKKQSQVARYLLNLGVKIYVIKHTRFNDLSNVYEAEGREGIITLIKNAQPYDELQMAAAALRS